MLRQISLQVLECSIQFFIMLYWCKRSHSSSLYISVCCIKSIPTFYAHNNLTIYQSIVRFLVLYTYFILNQPHIHQIYNTSAILHNSNIIFYYRTSHFHPHQQSHDIEEAFQKSFHESCSRSLSHHQY